MAKQTKPIRRSRCPLPPPMRETEEGEAPLSEAEIAQGVREGIFRAAPKRYPPPKRRDMRAGAGMPYVTKGG